jgi:RNA polymerase sigma-70 factor (ECF subfamily)
MGCDDYGPHDDSCQQKADGSDFLPVSGLLGTASWRWPVPHGIHVEWIRLKIEPIMIKPRSLYWEEQVGYHPGGILLHFRLIVQQGHEESMAAGTAWTVWNVTGAVWPGTADLDLDSTLVARCLSGEDAAWEELVRLHTRRVYGICYRFTGRDSEAQDLTQDVFLRVFRALGGFRSTEGSFATWLTRLTRNLLIDHYRRTRNQRVTDSIEEQLPRVEEGFVAVSRPDSVLAGREASELLQGALKKLSPELRETIILRDLQEMEYREIADVLGIPEGTVKSRLNRGRAELARLLKKHRTAV